MIADSDFHSCFTGHVFSLSFCSSHFSNEDKRKKLIHHLCPFQYELLFVQTRTVQQYLCASTRAKNMYTIVCIRRRYSTKNKNYLFQEHWTLCLEKLIDKERGC